MKRHTAIILGCILLVAAALRLFKLDSVPPSLYWEEAALGYDAYSIAQTGKDYHGNPWPVVAFTSFGDYKPPLYFYTMVPFVKTMGLNAWSVRLPSAIAGVLTVLVVFLIARKLYGNSVGLLSSAVLAVQPWSLQLSRVGFETNLATLLIAVGVLCLLQAKKKPAHIIAAAVFFVLSMYTYHAARVVAPLLAIAYILAWKQFTQVKWLVVSGVVALLMLLPIILNLKSPAVTQRAAETSIFSDIQLIEESNRMREESGNSLMSRIVYHRYMLFGERILSQYTKNFSPTFLFLEGDENQRHGVGEFGVLYHWELPVMLIALFVLVKNRKTTSLLPLTWIVIAALPVALTNLSPHTLRFASAMPAFAILSGYGLYSIYQLVGKKFRKLFTLFMALIVIGSTLAYLHFYYVHYSRVSALQWQYGYQELFSRLNSLKKVGQHVYVTREQGRPSIYYLFYNSVDPHYVQQQDATTPKDQQELLKVDDFYFVDKIDAESGSLVASTPEKRDPLSTELSTITLPDGKVIWSIWEKP